MAERPSRESLADILLSLGLIDEGTHDRVLEEMGRSGAKAFDAFLDLESLTEELVAQALARHLDLLLLRLRPGDPSETCRGLLPHDFCLERLVLPIRLTGDRLLLGMVDPTDDESCHAVERRLSCRVERAIVLGSELGECLAMLHGSTPMKVLFDLREELDGSHPLVSEFLEDMLVCARAQGVDALHLDPLHGSVVLRHRVEGSLRPVDHLPRRLATGLIERLKAGAGIDPRPQVSGLGFWDLPVNDKVCRLSVRSQWTCRGERLVLTFAPMKLNFRRLEALGLQDEQLRDLRQATSVPGLVVLTGLTGSGRSTTLYASLVEQVERGLSVFSIEWVEQLSLPGMQQLQIRPAEGFGFAQAIDHVSRKDRPDVLAVADFSCHTTMRAAAEAARRGSRVLAISSGRSPADLLMRLRDNGLGKEAAETLRCVVHQRLLRRLCTACREPYEAPHALVRHLDLKLERGDLLHRPRMGGTCVRCHGRGYLGASVIFELLPIDGCLMEALRGKVPYDEIPRLCSTRQGKALRDRALELALRGETSLEEAIMATTDRRSSERDSG